MLHFFKWYHKKLESAVEIILTLEKRENIRKDFVNFYEACLIPHNSPVRRIYFTKKESYYLRGITEWGEKAKKYNPFKKLTKNTDETLEDVDILNDLFTMIDIIKTFLPYFFTGLTFLSFYQRWSEIFSVVFLVFAFLTVIIGWVIEIIRIDSQTAQSLINGLIFLPTDFQGKEKIIAMYIWNRSLCNYSTLSAFLLLLSFKKLTSINSYNRLKTSLIRILPLCTPSYFNKRSKIAFIICYIKNRKKATNPHDRIESG